MPIEKRNSILRLLCEGNSIRSITRLLSTNIASVLRQLEWAGEHCQHLMNRQFRNLTLNHLECDEIWTFVGKKQARLTVTEKASKGNIGDIYLWYGIDQQTKLIPALVLGKRSADMARRFMRLMASRLEFPSAHASDVHAFVQKRYQPITQISTDGFAGYPEAIDLAFGPYVNYGQLIKVYRNDKMPYTPSELVGTDRRVVFGKVDEADICTSHVERHNLTIRTFMKRFTRLALGFSKKLEYLEHAVNLHAAYYNFCWRPGKLRVTPAIAAGITHRLWTFDDLLA